jgi:hypothetical protein
MVSKYDPLGHYLKTRAASEVAMSFADIEKVIGGPLPPKAVNHPAWWSNNTSNNTMTKVWLDAGYRTERVDVSARKLIFRRSGRPINPVAEDDPQGASPSRRAPSATVPGGLMSRLRAALGGSVRVAPGVSLAAPTGESWETDS